MCDRPALIVLWLTAPSVLDLLASQSNTFFFGDFLFGEGISVHFSAALGVVCHPGIFWCAWKVVSDFAL